MTLAGVLGAAGLELTRQGATFALVGGLAVSVRSEPRFTRDVDLAVAVADDREAEQHVHGFVTAGYVVDSTSEQAARGRLATVRLLPPGAPGGAGTVIDILFAASGIEPELVSRSERLEVLPGVTVPVARTGDLIALKLLARDDAERPQDLVDLRVLSSAATDEDWALARASCEMIIARGFHRDRDLVGALAGLSRG